MPETHNILLKKETIQNYLKATDAYASVMARGENALSGMLVSLKFTKDGTSSEAKIKEFHDSMNEMIGKIADKMINGEFKDFKQIETYFTGIGKGSDSYRKSELIKLGISSTAMDGLIELKNNSAVGIDILAPLGNMDLSKAETARTNFVAAVEAKIEENKAKTAAPTVKPVAPVASVKTNTKAGPTASAKPKSAKVAAPSTTTAKASPAPVAAPATSQSTAPATEPEAPIEEVSVAEPDPFDGKTQAEFESEQKAKAAQDASNSNNNDPSKQLLGGALSFLFGDSKRMENSGLWPKLLSNILGLFGIQLDPGKRDRANAEDLMAQFVEYDHGKIHDKGMKLLIDSGIVENNVTDKGTEVPTYKISTDKQKEYKAAIKQARDQATKDFDAGLSNDEILQNYKQNIDKLYEGISLSMSDIKLDGKQTYKDLNLKDIKIAGVTTDGQNVGVDDFKQTVVTGPEACVDEPQKGAAVGGPN